jgi:transposase
MCGPRPPSGSRLEAVVTTAAMNEADKSAWWRAHGAYPEELAKWRASATTALAAPEELRASPQATRAATKRIKELELKLQTECNITLASSTGS